MFFHTVFEEMSTPPQTVFPRSTIATCQGQPKVIYWSAIIILRMKFHSFNQSRHGGQTLPPPF